MCVCVCAASDVWCQLCDRLIARARVLVRVRARRLISFGFCWRWWMERAKLNLCGGDGSDGGGNGGTQQCGSARASLRNSGCAAASTATATATTMMAETSRASGPPRDAQARAHTHTANSVAMIMIARASAVFAARARARCELGRRDALIRIHSALTRSPVQCKYGALSALTLARE